MDLKTPSDLLRGHTDTIVLSILSLVTSPTKERFVALAFTACSSSDAAMLKSD